MLLLLPGRGTECSPISRSCSSLRLRTMSYLRASSAGLCLLSLKSLNAMGILLVCTIYIILDDERDKKRFEFIILSRLNRRMVYG